MTHTPEPEKFVPTHRISDHQRRILVRCTDGFGPCYTKQEWLFTDKADWELVPLEKLSHADSSYRLTFMGVHIPHAKIRSVK